ncbi:MAG TPA: hypothetical protein VFJ65_12620 [Solirubrobacterales bacterium]|nr:hypothetical protein [Solirubrobacterales bacterium]
MEPKNYGRNLKGELLTEELIEKLVQEAEKGWEVEELLTWRDLTPEPELKSDDRDQGFPSRPSRHRR